MRGPARHGGRQAGSMMLRVSVLLLAHTFHKWLRVAKYQTIMSIVSADFISGPKIVTIVV